MNESISQDLGNLAPAASGERISSLDFIRGIAVMGILAANIIGFGQPFTAYMYPEGFLVPSGDENGWLWTLQFVLIDGKMRGLFTLLFGTGMILFLERAWSRGATRWLQFRRLIWLALFGLAHFYFIWFGDILFAYAMVGSVLLLCVKWRPSTQLRVGLFGYLIGAALYAAMMVPAYLVADTPLGGEERYAEMGESLTKQKQDITNDGILEAGLKQSGDYIGLIQHKLDGHLFDPLNNTILFSLEAFPLMLIGMALYRMGMFGDGFDRASQRFWGWAGLIGGGAITFCIALWTKSIGFTFYGTMAAFIGLSPIPRLMMVLGLAALLALYGARASGWLAQRISAAGRAAFTNYLGTSIVMLFVFHGWALGLFGELNRPQLYLVVLISWALMLLWSKPWLDRYRFGPLEWLWRCLTYGKIFALKR